ncbi:uncharacterized protein LOC125240039 [Leguminivora glycinivorella]|uniref:uncharacterized protein LOC125240039 n=1 Tax=Leguminivora glycinivorella TaxID=1035111 RepID=UPI00200F31C2|nr:uncharacterized protein LOC125240039 [Leguminivora glycinivorella]
MASLRFVVTVVAAVVASFIVYASGDAALRERIIKAESICEKVDCRDSCIYQYFGVIDKDGKYVESKAVEMMGIAIEKKMLNETQVAQIAKHCNSVNKDMMTGCARGRQVNMCIEFLIREASGRTPEQNYVPKKYNVPRNRDY